MLFGESLKSEVKIVFSGLLLYVWRTLRPPKIPYATPPTAIFINFPDVQPKDLEFRRFVYCYLDYYWPISFFSRTQLNYLSSYSNINSGCSGEFNVWCSWLFDYPLLCGFFFLCYANRKRIVKYMEVYLWNVDVMVSYCFFLCKLFGL